MVAKHPNLDYEFRPDFNSAKASGFLWIRALPLAYRVSLIPDIIEAQDLKKIFGNVIAVDSISFAVKKGEVFGFLGPNGAGKTSTMKIIACVSPRTSGVVKVFGMDPELFPAEIKQRLGVVPQETNLDPDFTCYGNLFTYSRYFDISPDAAHKKAEELLEFVQLQEKRDVTVEKLSGGMKRREAGVTPALDAPWHPVAPDLPALGLALTRRIAEQHQGDRRQAQGGSIRLVRRVLGVPAGSGRGSEREWYQRLAPLVAMIPALGGWPPRERHRLAAALAAKGGPRERDYALRLQQLPRLRLAWQRAAALPPSAPA